MVSFEGWVEAEEVDGEEGVGEVQVLVDLFCFDPPLKTDQEFISKKVP